MQVVTENVYYPANGHAGLRITYIKGINHKNGGYVSVEGGGVGSRYTKIHLKYKRNKGLHYTVNIYGKPY